MTTTTNPPAKTTAKKGTSKRSVASKREAVLPKEKEAPLPKDKGAEVLAPRTRTTNNKGVTKAARDLDKQLEDVLTKMNHPVALPVQVSHPRNCVHSGLFMLDLIMCGGYRKGRMYTLLARPGNGKSTLIQEAIAAAQLQGLRIFHFDMEHSSARQYMVRQGILLDDSYRLDDGSRGYYYLDPESGEEFYRMAGRLLRALPKDDDPDEPPKTIVLVDSYEAFTSDAVTDTKEPIGVFARMHSMWQKKLRREVRRAGAVLVATNQLRTSGIGSFFVDDEDDAGGYALKFYADCRVFIRMGNPKQELGVGVCKGSFRTKKNRMADPFKKAEDVRLILGRGYDRLHDRLMFLVTTGQIKRDGAYYKIGDKKLQYKRARELMCKAKYLDRCFSVSKRMATYENYFSYDAKVEAWDEETPNG